MTLPALLEKLEKAEEGSRDLDYAIAEFLGRENVREMQSSFAPWKYTASLDAALSLVPDGWKWALRQDPRCYRALLARGAAIDLVIHRGEAVTPALAMTIASLKARTQ